MPVKRGFLKVLGLSAALLPLVCVADSHQAAPPRLILQITVDALRGDFPTRFASMLGEGGLRYLMEQGVYFDNARYQHANTETIVGHASLATGTTPAGHGMVANVWFDRTEERLRYNIEDPRHHLLSAGADVDQQTEIDPTQRAARSDGRSPAAMLATTFSDELAVHFNGQSKIFGVSVKDRGAVSMAGHGGKAFWFSKASGDFISSSYYYDTYPAWIIRWNAESLAKSYAGQSWELLHERERYLFAEHDDQDFETDFPGFGRTFPHAYGEAHDPYFTTRLTLSPAGDELTLDFALTLLEAEGLGQDSVPDYLAISFSSTDYVGHIFGASSLESEDNLAHLDRTLATLFAEVDRWVGLEHTLIVLSADHGQPEVPGYLHGLGMAQAQHFNTQALDTTPAINTLKARFGIGEALIQDFFQPYIYLNRGLIAEQGLDQGAVEQAVAEELMKFPGVALAVSSTALRRGGLADTPLMRMVLNNFHPDRSGDVYIVFEANVFIADFDGLTVASTHGSPWRYDSYVPVMFGGINLIPAVLSRPVTPYDIAPTLARVLGIKPPSASIGEPLAEVLGR